MKPRVEIHIPISPTESFFRQVHYLVVSLRQRGGILKNSPIIVTVGDDCEPYDIQRKVPWTREYPIEFRWVPRLLYQKQSYFATGLQRYQYPFQAPFVLFLDADMGLSRNLDDLLDRAAQDPGFYSVLAYGSPWGNSDLLHVRSDEDWWREAFAAASLGEPPFTCEYAGSGVIFDERVRRCPPYFNQGFVLAPASMVSALGSVLSQELEAATRAAETFYRFQVALTLAIVRQNLPWRALSIRFNFAPALADVFKVMPEEWEDARDWRQSFFPVNDKQISLSF